MKILITGLPGVGKTTILQKIITKLHEPFWVLSEDIKDREGHRVGFCAKTSSGLSGTFAHKSEISSLDTIGAYRVDISAIDKLFCEPLSKLSKHEQFIVIDEIGRMQMLSPKFRDIIRVLLGDAANILATIRFDDEWTREFTDKSDVITFTLTAHNHAEVEGCIKSALKGAVPANNFSKTQSRILYKMARGYLNNNQFIQFKKLFDNAVFYVSGDYIKRIGSNSYQVAGHHKVHAVTKESNKWNCDCDLFNGRGVYRNKPGECSHIQAIELVSGC